MFVPGTAPALHGVESNGETFITTEYGKMVTDLNRLMIRSDLHNVMRHSGSCKATRVLVRQRHGNDGRGGGFADVWRGQPSFGNGIMTVSCNQASSLLQ